MAFIRSNPNIGRHHPHDHYQIVTDGFDDSEILSMQLHYTERSQPDLGGALNFSYDLLELPVYPVTGPFMVPNPHKTFRTVGPVTAYFQQAPVTGMGGTFTGGFQFQPLLDPNIPGGFDVNDI